jgi:head-tail adaptor
MAKAGVLREKAVFKKLAVGQVDQYGNTYTGWTDRVTRMVDLIERVGREAIEGGALSDVVQATLRLRKDSATDQIKTADMVTVRGHDWAVKSVVQLDRKGTMLDILVERGVAL